MIIVRHTVKLIVAAWDDTSINPLQTADTALACIFHPAFLNPNNMAPVQREMMDWIGNWARSHPQEIARLDREHVRNHTNTRSGKAEPHEHGGYQGDAAGGQFGNQMAHQAQGYLAGQFNQMAGGVLPHGMSNTVSQMAFGRREIGAEGNAGTSLEHDVEDLRDERQGRYGGGGSSSGGSGGGSSSAPGFPHHEQYAPPPGPPSGFQPQQFSGFAPPGGAPPSDGYIGGGYGGGGGYNAPPPRFPDAQPGGYPGEQGGYPGQQQGGYPGQQGGYPGQQGGYPGQQGGYQGQQGGYSNQQAGYQGQQGGYQGGYSGGGGYGGGY